MMVWRCLKQTSAWLVHEWALMIPDGFLSERVGKEGDAVKAARSELRALVVSYAFPPVGGAGVQRMLKLVKYLPSHGITPTMLTVKNPSVPVLDASLERDIPARMRVIRAHTLEPGYGMKQAAWDDAAGAKSPGIWARVRSAVVAAARQALVPDAQLLWQPAAQLALGSVLLRGGTDVVLISGPPFSQFLLAPLARLRKGVGVVLDYRDEWSTYRDSYEMAPAMAHTVSESIEASVLRAAHFVTTATERFRQNLLDRHPFLEPSRVRAIPNGYDPDDLPSTFIRPPADKLVLTYAGTIFKLTSARGLLGGLRRLHQRAPALASLLKVRFFGRIVETEQDAFEGSELLGVERNGYIEHDRVLGELSASHGVICLLDDVPGAERIYPGKVFELMCLRRPCLTLAPEGALTDLVRRHNLGEVVAPRDEAAIAEALERMIVAFREGALPLEADVRDIERFHRRSLAGEFGEVLWAARRAAR